MPNYPFLHDKMELQLDFEVINLLFYFAILNITTNILMIKPFWTNT